MRILQLIQKLQNRGAETFACQLSNHLVDYGHEVVLVAVFEGTSVLPFKGKIQNLSGTAKKRFFDYRAWQKLASIIKEFNPDIVQVNAGDTLKYAVFSKLFFKWTKPIVVRNASDVEGYLNTTPQKLLNNFLYRDVDGVISVSEACKASLIRNYSFLREKTVVIPIGVENHDIPSVPLKPFTSHNIVHVGGFTFEKNHIGLLRIFKSLLEKKPTAHLHLLGDGPLRRKIEKQVIELDLVDNVFFYGFVQNPLSYIKSSNVLILPSIIEGLPGVLLEAMYCKVPVIAYDVGGISEIVTPKTGVLITENDESHFVEAINNVLEGKSESEVEEAYQMISDTYMNDKITLRFLSFYKTLCDSISR